jgi:hypothetical protein
VKSSIGDRNVSGGSARFSCSIIGSFRKHYSEVCDTAKTFSDAEVVVLSPRLSRIIDPSDWYVRLETDIPGDKPEDIQLITLERIFRSSFVYVLSTDGYVGRTTCYEIGRIVERNIPLFFSEIPGELPMPIPDSAIIPADKLASYIQEKSELPPIWYDGFSLRTRQLCEAISDLRVPPVGCKKGGE